MNFFRLLPWLFLFLSAALLCAQAGDDPKKKAPPPLDGLKALKHPDAGVRYRAAETLAQVGPLGKFAVPELRELLKDKNALVRVKAAEALWKIDQTPSTVLLPVLLQALKDKNPHARAAAPPVIVLLGKKAKAALPALTQALNDQEFDVKLAAVVALGDLGPVAKNAADDLLDLAKDKDFFLLEPFVGAALANLGASVVPELAKALADSSSQRRRVAAYALGSMGASAAPAATALAESLKSDDPSTRKQAAQALGKIGKDAQKILPQLEAVLTDEDTTIRIEAALATWLITGETQHIRIIVKALNDQSVNVRDIACQTLAKMKGSAKEAVEPLTKLLPDKELRIRVIITLGEIGPLANQALPELKKLLKDRDDETQLQAAFALWRITGKTKEALPVIEKGLESSTHDKLAIRLLGGMGEAAQSVLPTLVLLYRDEEELTYRQLLAAAIKKIDAKAAQKLGIR